MEGGLPVCSSAGYRAIAGKTSDWINTSRGLFSNYLFLKDFAPIPPLRRIFSLQRDLGFKSIVIDEISDCEIKEQDDEDLRYSIPAGSLKDIGVLGDSFQRSKVYKIPFFKTEKNDDVSADDFLGYAVIKHNHSKYYTYSHVYESVIPINCRSGCYLHSKREYEVINSLGTFKVQGVLYAQQNIFSYACAHVGVRTFLSSVLPEGDIDYSEINKITNIDNRIAGFGFNGLDDEGIEKILQNKGFVIDKISCEPEKGDMPTRDYNKEMYGYIESGLPCLLGFQLNRNPGKEERHIIPVIGHTFDEDTWVAPATRYFIDGKSGYFSSQNWCGTSVVHDDNYGPYYSIPRSYFTNDNFRVFYGPRNFHKAKTAVEIETIAIKKLDYITDKLSNIPGNFWYDVFGVFANEKMLVLRAIYVSKKKYMDHLGIINDWNSGKIDEGVKNIIESSLTEKLWVVEISCQDLFASSKRKFGEILFSDCEQTKKITMLAVRLPGLIIIPDSDESKIRCYDCNLNDHSQLIR